MTVCCAVRDGDAVWIGADGRVTGRDGFLIRDDVEKWRLFGGFHIAVSGHMRLEVVTSGYDNTGGAQRLAEQIRFCVKSDGWVSAKVEDGGPEEFCYEMIIVDPERRVWLVDGSGAMLDMGSQFAAIGSGAPYAYGAAFVYPGHGGEAMVKNALAAACRYDRDCGGALFVGKVA